MQEKYLGDSHDYAKYALLRHFAQRLDLRLGLNWYLTQSSSVDKAGNNDGEKRHHFGRRSWRGWEPDILQQLAPLQLAVNRRMDDFYQLGILPAETIYFDDLVPTDERTRWHHSALGKLLQADLIFIDPDNGFEVISMTRRTTPKYALYSEARDYLEEGKV